MGLITGYAHLNTKTHYKRRGALGPCGGLVIQPWSHTELCDNLSNKKTLNGNLSVMCYALLCHLFLISHTFSSIGKYLFGDYVSLLPFVFYCHLG